MNKRTVPAGGVTRFDKFKRTSPSSGLYWRIAMECTDEKRSLTGGDKASVFYRSVGLRVHRCTQLRRVSRPLADQDPSAEGKLRNGSGERRSRLRSGQPLS